MAEPEWDRWWQGPLLDALRTDPTVSLRGAARRLGGSVASVRVVAEQDPRFQKQLDEAIASNRALRDQWRPQGETKRTERGGTKRHGPDGLLLALLREGAPLKDAAHLAGIPIRTVTVRRRSDASYDADVIRAAEEGGRRLGPVVRATCPTHCGTPTGYDYGCRKQACTAAKSAKVLTYRRRKESPRD